MIPIIELQRVNSAKISISARRPSGFGKLFARKNSVNIFKMPTDLTADRPNIEFVECAEGDTHVTKITEFERSVNVVLVKFIAKKSDDRD